MAIDESQVGSRLLLDQVLRKGDIVPFVGAGLSSAFGLPTWANFLRRIAVTYELQPVVEPLIGEGQYELAAQALLNLLTERPFYDEVLGAFGDHAIKEPSVPTAASYLPFIATGPVLTTNFDHVLEHVFSRAERPFEQIILGTQHDDIVDAIGRNQRALIKLHGDVSIRTDRILTYGEYELNYGSSGNHSSPTASLSRALKLLTQQRTVLFLGCSLKADRIVGLLQSTAQEMKTEAIRHFAVVPRPPQREIFLERVRLLGACSVSPIWYPDGGHDDIPPYLRQLLESTGVSIDTVLGSSHAYSEFRGTEVTDRGNEE